MKWSFATVGIIVLGIIGVTIIILFQQVTTTNENDYYLLKEIAQSAMIDSIDISYYRETGDLKIVREKFVENFTRRFAESTLMIGTEYNLSFYDIMETPPKVSIMVNTGINDYTVYDYTADYNVKNRLDAILEYVGKNTYTSITGASYNNPYTHKETAPITYYAIITKDRGSGTFKQVNSLKIPEELIAPNIKNVKIDRVPKIGWENVTKQAELNDALLKDTIYYNNKILDISPASLNLNSYATTIYSSGSVRYNCGTKEGYSGIGTSEYKCDDDNLYYIKLEGNTRETDKTKVIFKYQVIWSYDEYEFKNS